MRDIIKNLKNKPGLDYCNLNSKLIKSVREEILYHLTDLINNCIKNGVFPDSLKVAKVLPIQKTKNSSDLGNLRPISIIPVLAKVFETVLKDQIVKFYESNNLFNFGQFGFRAEKSTTDALIYLINKIIEGTENEEIVGRSFVTLLKHLTAFPTVFLFLN